MLYLWVSASRFTCREDSHRRRVVITSTKKKNANKRKGWTKDKSMPRMGPLDESQRTRLVRRTTKIPICLFRTFFPTFFFFVIFLLCSSSGCFICRAKRKIALTTNNLSEEIPQTKKKNSRHVPCSCGKASRAIDATKWRFSFLNARSAVLEKWGNFPPGSHERILSFIASMKSQRLPRLRIILRLLMQKLILHYILIFDHRDTQILHFDRMHPIYRIRLMDVQ